MMVMNLALPSDHFEGFRPAHCRRKAYLLAWGIVPHQSNASQQDFWPFRWRQGAISGGGGHGDVGVVSHWPLAIGCLVLLLARILHNSRNSINVHTQRIFSGLKYLDWSKTYSACPVMLNKIQAISYLDPIQTGFRLVQIGSKPFRRIMAVTQ